MIRKIKREELSLVRDFAPPGWNVNLEKLFGQHYDQSYFADTDQAGIELLKFKVSRERSMVCIPEANAVAMEFLVSIGYQPYLTATRMYLGKNIVWQPGKVYARGSGALG